jgi:hypothetical protein
MDETNLLIERAQKEYEHVVSELARSDTDHQKLFPGISVSVFMTAAFATSAVIGNGLLFLSIPLVALILIQYLIANSYAMYVYAMYSN